MGIKLTRKRLIKIAVAVVFIAVIYGTIDFLFIEDAKPYFHAEYYEKTGLVTGDDGKVIVYGSKDGFITIVLRRGRPHSTVTTAHGYSEKFSIELPGNLKKGRIDLQESENVSAFRAYMGREFWNLGKGGAKGYIDILSVNNSSFTASYNITIDAWNGSDDPHHSNRKTYFVGENKPFYLKPRPDSR